MNLDKILVKAKEVFESAYKKTEGAVNIGKQKLDVSALEAKLNKSYETLGKLCYDAIVNGGVFDPESVKPVTDDIAEKKQQIEEIKKDILKAKNKKICPACNAPMDKGATYCGVCGKKAD